jgi:4'-phosphopantetheinyl transferase
MWCGYILSAACCCKMGKYTSVVQNLPQENLQSALSMLPRYETAVDGVRVVWFRRDASESVCEPLSMLLNSQERQRAERMVFAADRYASIVVHALKRVVLAEQTGIDPLRLEFRQNEQGKPFVVGSDLQFNLSHAGAYAVMALARGRRVGVDIEPIRPFADAVDIARRFFSAGEAERLQTLDGTAGFDRAFFECWTRKEAFVKALGGGLSIPLNGFEVSFYPSPKPMLAEMSVPTGGWRLHDLKLVDGYASALVSEVFS